MKIVVIQGEKLIKALEEHQKQLVVPNANKKHDYDDESPELLNQKKKLSWSCWRKSRWNIKIKQRN